MFGTVATTAMVDLPTVERRGRAVSLLMMAETGGLLLGTAAGGWLYQSAGVASPFTFEAACMVVAAVVVGFRALPAVATTAGPVPSRGRRSLVAALGVPGVLVMSGTSAALTAIQTGVLVFLVPLYLVQRGGLGPDVVGLFVSLSVLGRLLALWLGGSASSRSGRLRALVPGLVGYAVVLASGPFLTHPVALAGWSLAIGAAAGFVAALPVALVGDSTPPALHGVAIGWLRTMTDGGQILGPLVMGTLADVMGLAAPFHLGAALLVLAAWRCRRHATATSTAVATGDRS
jgi:MFS family permease